MCLYKYIDLSCKFGSLRLSKRPTQNMFFDHRPKNIRLTKKTRIRITFHCMLYNFYLRKFYEKRIIKKKLAGAWIPLNKSPLGFATFRDVFLTYKLC